MNESRQQALDAVVRRVPPWALRAIPSSLKSYIKKALGARDPSGAQQLFEKEHLRRTEYDELWERTFSDRTGNSREYLLAHRERYYELLNAMVLYLRDRGSDASVLEVGVSEYLALYRALFPALRLVTLDRPVALHGADEAWSKRIAGAERHYNADLNLQPLSPAWGSPPLGQFDFIICTEVLEHLVVNPVELLEGLVSLLKPEGLLYLTTPNFFRRENLDKFGRRVNPQPVYPRRGDNSDAHHHFREFSMSELAGFVSEAGGKVVAQYFSACWDAPAVRNGPAEERSNLVLVIAPRGTHPAQA